MPSVETRLPITRNVIYPPTHHLLHPQAVRLVLHLHRLRLPRRLLQQPARVVVSRIRFQLRDRHRLVCPLLET